MRIEEHQPLGQRTTLGVGGPARFAAEIAAEAEIPEAVAWARGRGLAWLAWGAGSNLLVSDAGFGGLAAHIALRGVRFGDGGEVEAAAGEDWDALVAACVARGWAGIECLSGIPGTVGATPVQNVGAYGQEVGEVLERVRAWDTQREAWVELGAKECGFGYRASRFNGADRGRFVVASVTLRLRPGGAATVRYPELQRWLGHLLLAPPSRWSGCGRASIPGNGRPLALRASPSCRVLHAQVRRFGPPPGRGLRGEGRRRGGRG